jgi:hypothetical protein
MLLPMALLRAVSNAFLSCANIFIAKDGADKYEWRPIVFSYRPIPLLYRLSSWGFTLVGVLILMFRAAMSRCDSGFWWRTVGSGLSLQGGMSYMADVYTWGRRDLLAQIWKWGDLLLACTLTSFCGPVMCYRMLLGSFVVDADLVSVWNLAVMLALASKIMGARETKKNKDLSCELCFSGTAAGMHCRGSGASS